MPNAASGPDVPAPEASGTNPAPGHRARHGGGIYLTTPKTATMSDVFVAGETLVDLVPTGEGSLDEVGGFHHEPGGAPANVAVGLSELGSPPRFWTRLGVDAFGDYLYRVLRRHDVPEEFVVRMDGERTTLAVVSPPGSDHRPFEFYDGTGGTFAFSPDRVSDAPLSDSSWVHFGGVVLAHRDGARAMLDLAERASEAGCLVSFDPNVRRSLWERADRERLETAVERAVRLSDVVFCSREDFASAPFETDSEQALARDLVERGPHTAFVTRGEAGAVALSTEDSPWETGQFSHGGFDVSVVDTTGAGDAFAAAAIHLLRPDGERTALPEVLAFANRVASLTVRERGGTTALPALGDVELFGEPG